jgi:hypothetical protein
LTLFDSPESLIDDAQEEPVKTKFKPLAVALAVVALAPAAAFADTASPSDKANGARACQALKATMGAATFASTYATFGKCVSAWTRAEHQNRHDAEAACAAENPSAKRGAVQKCVQAKLAAERAAERRAVANAARACKAERSSMGAAAFKTKYGGKANAFGKCVAKLAEAKGE